MEILTVKGILSNVNESISNIAGILQGTEMLTDKIQTEAKFLLKGQVPTSWEQQWEGPESPSQWIVTVNQKAVALLNWLQKLQQK
jgi:hypothetical protein